MSSLWPLTARAEELELLAGWYRDLAVGGCVIAGDAGVGKTRLAEEALRHAEAASLPVARAIGHPAVQLIPLGAMAHLLPREIGEVGYGEDGRAALFHAARTALQERAGDQRLLMVIDDVDQLDDTSLALLLPMTLDRSVFPIATIRTGRTMPPAVAALIKDDHLRRLDLGLLSSSQVATLLHRVLDAPLDHAGLARLHTQSGGNVQLLRELVRSALDQQALQKIDDTWRLVAAETSPALEELVMSRVGELDRDEREVLELLALAGRMGLADLESMVDNDKLVDLEARALIGVTVDGQRTEVALTHPLYVDVLCHRMTKIRERTLQRVLGDLIERHGARRRGDTLRLARWRLEAGGRVDRATLLHAGRLALVARDGPLARRFADAAINTGDSPAHAVRIDETVGSPVAAHDQCEAAIVKLEAQMLCAASEDAEQTALSVWDHPSLTDQQRAHLARRVADLRFAANVDLDAALAISVDATKRITEPAASASVLAHRAGLLANAAKPLEALMVLSAVPAVDDPTVRVELASARSLAFLSLGRSGHAIAAAREGVAARAELPAWLGTRGQASHLMAEAHALAYTGEYAAATKLIEPAWQRAREHGAAAATVWFELVLAEIARDTGYGAKAVEHFSSAAASAHAAGQSAAMVWALVGIAQGWLLQGEVESATSALRDADDFGPSPVGTSHTTRERCRAWLTAARGDLAAARSMLRAIADESAADGVYLFEVSLLHDVARFGDASSVTARLDELSDLVDGPLAQAMTTHARGSATEDRAILLDALERFESCGSLVLAAEVAAELAELHRRAQDARAAAAIGQRMHRLIERVGGAKTPPMLRGSAVEPLTAREREVALLAATGISSKDIADRLYLSKRTVDTHLDRIYRKLGIGGRDELSTALAGEAVGPRT